MMISDSGLLFWATLYIARFTLYFDEKSYLISRL